MFVVGRDETATVSFQTPMGRNSLFVRMHAGTFISLNVLCVPRSIGYDYVLVITSLF
jgi:hypothetical protein